VKPERFEEVGRLYHAALGLELNRREAFLDVECAGDEELRREVQSLLEAHAKASGFMTAPALDAAARTLAEEPPGSQIGRTLGPYQVLSWLGAGGMGEVYLAQDIRLQRRVALKLLPRAFTADPERVRRFELEARAASALNHPNIVTIHDIGQVEGTHFIATEHIAGETLRKRITRAGMTLAEALDVAAQIASALAAAHEEGLVHRDVKPENVMLRRDGYVKVLDFGLAKLVERAGERETWVPSHGRTAPGMVIGTVAYMSPEQARGDEVDARSDVFSLGVVLYEMVAGRTPFAGSSSAEILAGILEREPPPLARYSEDVPAELERIVAKALRKNRDERYQVVKDLYLDLKSLKEVLIRLRHIAGVPADLNDATALSSERARPSRTVRWVAVFSVLAGAAVAAVVMWLALQSTPPRVTRTTIMTPATAAPSAVGVDTGLRITPDGARLVYIGNSLTQVFVRPLDALEPVPLVSAGYLQGVFISPDGHWVGYMDTAYTLKKVPITGGPSVSLLTLDGPSRGETWTPDNTIVFATGATDTGLQQVSADGGPVTVLTRPNRELGEADHIRPQILPDGHGVLFTITATSGGLDAVAVLDLASGISKTLVRGGQDARYVPSGHLVFRAGETLRAVAFDLAGRATRGTPVTVVAGVADLDVASDGTLVYLEPSKAPQQRTLVWVDRRGQETPLPAQQGAYYHPRISPVDNRRLAFSMAEDLWVWELSRAPARLTFTPGPDWLHLWMPDGERLVYGSWRGGGLSNLYIQAADGTGPAERLSESRHHQLPSGITADGAAVLFTEPSARGRGIRLLRLALRREESLLETPLDERNGMVSPDMKWLAYEADTAANPGQYQVYVRPFPNIGDGVWQVSSAGGTHPLWSRKGDELFYAAAGGAMMAVPVAPHGIRWTPATPAKLFAGPYLLHTPDLGRQFDVTSDGRRFLMIKEGTAAPRHIVMVQHWAEELKRLVP
jgi:serine/threonine-protein kinase